MSLSMNILGMPYACLQDSIGWLAGGSRQEPEQVSPKQQDKKQASESGWGFSFKELYAEFLDVGKSVLKFIKKYNPISWLLDSSQKTRSNKTMDKALTRDHAGDDEAKIEAYHNRLLFTKENPDGVYQYHKSSRPGAKPLYILLMGRGQKFTSDKSDAGTLDLYRRLKEKDDADVMIFRVGSLIEDLKHRYHLSDDDDLRPEIVLEHISNLIEDKLAARGKFVGAARPSKINAFGYSWGGGALSKLMQRWGQIGGDHKVDFAMTLDPVEYGIENFGDELKDFPVELVGEYNNVRQDNDWLLNGGASVARLRSQDSSMTVEEFTVGKCKNHDGMDDCGPMLDKIFNILRTKALVGNQDIAVI